MRDIASILGFAHAIPPAAYNADNTPPAIDLLGFETAVIVIEVGVGGISFSGTNKVEFKLTHSADGTDYEAVTADDLVGVESVGTGGIVHALTAAHADPSITKVGYIGDRRFLKLLADFSGTHGTATPISAIVVKGSPRLAPVA